MSTAGAMRRGAMLAALLALAGCDDDSGYFIAVNTGGLRAVFVSCPSCDETVTFSAYGGYALLGTDPNVANLLISSCGFLVVPVPIGTPANSTQVQGCRGGVDLAFASGDLQAFRVRDGWGGHTNSGIRIRASVQDVLAAEPGFVRVDDQTYLLDDGKRRAEANFAADGTLVELVAGRGFRR